MNTTSHILYGILILIIGTLLVAAVAFLAAKVYIWWKRRPLKRHQYHGPDNVYSYEMNENDIDAPIPKGIDGSSAMDEYIH